MKSIGGPDLLLYLVLAFGGAMFVGNLLALIRPPSKRPLPKKGAASKQFAPKDPAKRAGTSSSAGSAKSPIRPTPLPVAPKGRTIAMMVIGGIASLWAIATLLSR